MVKPCLPLFVSFAASSNRLIVNFSYRIEVCLGLIHRLTGQFESVAELQRGAGERLTGHRLTGQFESVAELQREAGESRKKEGKLLYLIN